MDRNDFYIIPKNFKSGKYLFNRYKPVDLIILCGCSSIGLFIIISMIFVASEMKNFIIAITSIIIGLLIISAGFLLTINIPYYHNVLGKIKCIIRFFTKTKEYKWKGVDYKAYEEK